MLCFQLHYDAFFFQFSTFDWLAFPPSYKVEYHVDQALRLVATGSKLLDDTLASQSKSRDNYNKKIWFFLQSNKVKEYNRRRSQARPAPIHQIKDRKRLSVKSRGRSSRARGWRGMSSSRLVGKKKARFVGGDDRCKLPEQTGEEPIARYVPTDDTTFRRSPERRESPDWRCEISREREDSALLPAVKSDSRGLRRVALFSFILQIVDSAPKVPQNL